MEKDKKHYNKEAPLAEHALELTRRSLEGRIAEVRDHVARKIQEACLAGKTFQTFDKAPNEEQLVYGFTAAMYNEIYKELQIKGYKLDYTGEYLHVSWE